MSPPTTVAGKGAAGGEGPDPSHLHSLPESPCLYLSHCYLSPLPLGPHRLAPPCLAYHLAACVYLVPAPSRPVPVFLLLPRLACASTVMPHTPCSWPHPAAYLWGSSATQPGQIKTVVVAPVLVRAGAGASARA